MNHHTDLPIPDIDNWSAEQRLAVYDLCQTIAQTLMDRHGDELIELMAAIDAESGVSGIVKEVNPNLTLPFDDL